MRRKRYPGTHPRRFDEKYKEREPVKYPGIVAHVEAQGRTVAGTHRPVMLREVLEVLDPRPDDSIFDGTVGYGGHAVELLKRAARLTGYDVDAAALTSARARLEAIGKPFELRQANYAAIRDRYDVLFLDLGASSLQFDDPARGFSYKRDGPLDMRMNAAKGRTAAELLASMDVDALAAALDDPALAAAIVAAKPKTTRELRALVGDDPALAFQSIRILVNRELENLRAFVRAAPYAVKPGGRIAILSFHSGEDDIVAGFLKEGPRRPTREEVRANPRARSAILRWATF